MWEYYNPVNVIFGSEKFNEIEHIISNRKYILVTHPCLLYTSDAADDC